MALSQQLQYQRLSSGILSNVAGIYCKLFSDSINRNVRKELVDYADRKFSSIMLTFDFDNTDDFLFPPGHDRIEINLSLYNEPEIAAAFWGCVLMTVRAEEPDTNRLDYVLKHELAHSFEYLIEGTPELGTDVWFREGIAVYIGSNGGWAFMSTPDSLAGFIQDHEEAPNLGNPISIHQWEDFPDGSNIPRYYTVFDLVMKYILSPEGLGKTLDDILDIFYEVRNGAAFSDAFHNVMGISLSLFEEEIFSRLTQFLAEDIP